MPGFQQCPDGRLTRCGLVALRAIWWWIPYGHSCILMRRMLSHSDSHIQIPVLTINYYNHEIRIRVRTLKSVSRNVNEPKDTMVNTVLFTSGGRVGSCTAPSCGGYTTTCAQTSSRMRRTSTSRCCNARRPCGRCSHAYSRTL